MKMISFLAAALFATSALATTSVIHDYDAVLHGMDVNNVCVTPTHAKSIHATRSCVKLVPVTRTGGGEGQETYVEWVCEKWANTNASYPRAFERNVCTEVRNDEGFSGCVKTEVRQDFMPATIKIRTVIDQDEYSNYPGVQSHHTFPACK